MKRELETRWTELVYDGPLVQPAAHGDRRVRGRRRRSSSPARCGSSCAGGRDRQRPALRERALRRDARFLRRRRDVPARGGGGLHPDRRARDRAAAAASERGGAKRCDSLVGPHRRRRAGPGGLELPPRATTRAPAVRLRRHARPRRAAPRGGAPERRRARRGRGRASSQLRDEPVDAPDDEDVHSAIERLLGEVGRKIHAGPLAQRPGRGRLPALRRRTPAARRSNAIEALRPRRPRAGRARGARRSCPATRTCSGRSRSPLGHHLLAWVEMLDRDRERFRFAGGQAAAAPLGAGALAGSTLGLPAPPGDDDAQLARRRRRPRLRARLPLRGGRALRPPLADRRGALPLGVGRVRLRPAAGERRHRLVDDAAEAESRRRRARPRQGRDGDRPPGGAARDAQGPAARLQPRPPGGQAARLRRAPGRRRGARGADDARRRARARPRDDCAPRPPTRCSSPPTRPRRSSAPGRRSATRTSRWRRASGRARSSPPGRRPTASPPAERPGPGGVRAGARRGAGPLRARL